MSRSPRLALIAFKRVLGREPPLPKEMGSQSTELVEHLVLLNGSTFAIVMGGRIVKGSGRRGQNHKSRDTAKSRMFQFLGDAKIAEQNE